MSKPTFDPSQAFEKVSSDKPEFDSSLPFEKNMPPSELESALRGAAQGVTMGFAPAMVGAAESLPAALDVASGKSSLQDLMDRYNKAREASLANFKAAEKENPNSFLAGQLGGGILTAPLMPEAAGAMGAAKLGAGLGTLGGLGQSVSEGDSLSGAAKNAALQGLTGGVVGGAVGKLASALTPDSLKEFAAKRAAGATGLTKGEAKKLIKMPATDEAYPNRLVEHGKNLIENKVITPLSNPEAILENSEKLAETSGKTIGSILENFDKNATPEMQEQFFNPKTIADGIEQLQQSLTKDGKVLPVSKSEYNTLQDALETIKLYGDEPIDFQTAAKLKKQLSDASYKEGGMQDKTLAKVTSLIKDELEQAADKVATISGDPSVAQKYLQAKDQYRTALDAQKSITGKVAGEVVHNTLGITDYMAGLGGFAAHGGPGAIAAAGINKLGKAYGSTLLATGANGAADMLSSVGKTLAKANPIDLQSMGKRLIGTGDDLSSKLGNILVQASDKDTIGRNALIFSLLQNPSYRSLVHDILNEHK